MLNIPFKWTDQNVAVLQRMVRDGSSATQAADRLGCSRNAAVGKASRLGTPFHSEIRLPAVLVKRNLAKKAEAAANAVKKRLPWTQERLLKAAALWARNVSVPAMAQSMDVSTSTMTDVVKRYPQHFPERVQAKNWRVARVDVLSRRSDREAKATERAQRGFDSSIHAIPGVTAVRFIDLTTSQCHFPISSADGPSGADMACCGAESREDSPYCNVHHRLAYRPREMAIGGGRRA
jgi:hypothetical protein